MTSRTKPETHLFLIWSNARDCQEKILRDIQAHFSVLKVFDITWSEECFSNNLSRFYGQNLPDRSFKEVHCGRGAFLLVIIKDLNPDYQWRDTSHGKSMVNANIFDKKKLYRSWTGGGHKIHATDNLWEVNHNLSLLMGLNLNDFNQQFSAEWTESIESLEIDLVGARGWSSIQQLFYVMNSVSNYVVLRNFEGLPGQYTLESHGDIDLLVESKADTIYLLNAKPVFPNTERVLHYTTIAGSKILFDFRSVGDNYYCKDWEVNILKNRIYDQNGFFRPNEEDYFYSLLYHALIHKPFIASDYRERISHFATQMKIDLNVADFFRIEEVLALLGDYLIDHQYYVSKPDDVSVYFNQSHQPPSYVSLGNLYSGYYPN